MRASLLLSTCFSLIVLGGCEAESAAKPDASTDGSAIAKPDGGPQASEALPEIRYYVLSPG